MNTGNGRWQMPWERHESDNGSNTALVRIFKVTEQPRVCVSSVSESTALQIASADWP